MPAASPESAAARLAERTESLLGLTDLLARATSDGTTLRQAGTQAVAGLLDGTAALWLTRPDGHLQLAAFWDPQPAARAAIATVTVGVSHPPGEGFLWSVAGGGPLLLAEVRADELPGMHPAYRTYFERWGLTSMVLVPLRARDEILGVLGVSRRQGSEPFDDDDVAFVVRVGLHLALALDNAALVDSVRVRLDDSRAAAELIGFQATHDALTGLPNRVLLAERAEAALATRGAEDHVALLVLDLDGFKDVNDALGHTVGDDALRLVARRLSLAVPEPGLLARLGGDEFAVLLPRVEGTVEAVGVAHAVLAALREPFAVGDLRLALGGSVGAAVCPRDGHDVDTLLRYADLAMYRAKRSGTGWAAYDEALDRPAATRITRITDLRRGLDAGEMVLHWMPLVTAAAGRPSQWEGLLRWQHPERGLVGPLEVVELASQSGMIGRLTEVVLDLALDQLALWWADGRQLPGAVNVPASVVEDGDFVPQVLASLERRSLPARALVLEVTEAVLARDRARQALRELSTAGLRLSLDDFGTGWSSLTHLRELPIHQLKIDRSFITGLAEDPRDSAIVRAVIGLSHDLGLEVVAEGVERADVAALLDALGVDILQGYLYSPAMPAAETAGWLAATLPLASRAT